MAEAEKRLTELAHGGGCGCKLAPGVLQDLLSHLPTRAFPGLMVGTETSDDAAVYRLNASQALVATTDFFLPVVDDPHDFGRIAATNALSDVYAMGGTPILALAVLGIPAGRISIETVGRILSGGASVCADAGIPVAGGHSIDNPEPLYGLVALGLVHPDRVLRNSTAREGDTLVLTKGLGVGIYSAALKKGVLPPSLYEELISTTTQLNWIGAELPTTAGVHAVTDVTGFGVLGHTLEMCRGSGLAAIIDSTQLPWLPGAVDLAREGLGTGAATRNWASYGAQIRLPPIMQPWQRGLLCDPQTSGGLLISVAPEHAGNLLEKLRDAGFARATAIGSMAAGEPEIRVA